MNEVNKPLKLIIFPTEECNFRCKYCYEHFEIGRMGKNVVNGIKKLIIERSKDLKVLHLDWFGGEPLLAFDIIHDLMSFAIQCSHENGFVVKSGMTTNASLFTKSRQEQLISMGITDYQVSFDGDSDIHNKYRVTRRDTSTFHIIYNNLLEFHRSQLEGSIVIRLHVNRNNYDSLESLITKISRDFRDDRRFSLFIRSLERLGSPNDQILPVIDDEEESDVLVMALRNYARDLGLKLIELTPSQVPVCYAASFNSYIIRATGEIGKCTVALYDPENTIGRISEDGKMHIDREKLSYWVRGQFSGDRDELACPYAYKQMEIK